MLPMGSFPLRHGQTRPRQAKSSELLFSSAGFYTRVVGDPINSALNYVSWPSLNKAFTALKCL